MSDTEEMMKNQIKKFVEENPSLVARKKTSIPGVYVLKYKNRVFYKNLWTPELLECRGTVVDENYRVIQRPFTKIFNRGESHAPEIHRDTEVIAVQKVNGFMCAATWWNDDIFVSTTGSIDSDFAKLARRYVSIYEKMFRMYPEFTFIFEICSPEDPHIIDEKPGAYLLGTRLKRWNTANHYHTEEVLDNFASLYGMYRPSWKIARYGDIVKEVKSVHHEGFVVYTPDGGSVEQKIKSPFYLTTKFLGRLNDERVKLLAENPNEFRKRVDEEFYPIVYVISNDIDYFLSLDSQGRIEYVRDYFTRLHVA